MKKGLLVSTALLGIAAWSGSAMAADKVKLELGGYTKWFVVGAWNNTNYERATGQSFNNVDVKGDSDITFSGSTQLDNGLAVGVFTSLRAGTNTGAYGWGDDGNNYIDQAFLWVSSGYGKVLMGVMPNGALDVQAPEAVGQWNNDGMLTGNVVIARPDGGLGTGALPVLGINGNAINSTKILVGDSSGKQETLAYVTPTFYGFTAAAAYVPSSAKNVRGPSTTADNSHDVFGLSVNYTNDFGGVGVKASAGWARGSIGRNAAGGGATPGAIGQNLQIMNAGLNLSHHGFTVGGSYRHNWHDERSGGLSAGPWGFASLDGDAWDAGIMYATGPWSAGVAYYGSRIKGFSYGNSGKHETVTFVQGSAKYDLGPGVSLQGVVGYGEYKASTNGAAPRPAANKNDGWMAMSGVMVEF